MARRCICDRVEVLLEGRPWFKALDAGAKWLCFQLVKLLASPSYEGAIPFSDAERVSLLVSMRVSEVETHLETILETGLLHRSEQGVLTCPALGEAVSRAATARRNGSQGGRPRRGESAEDMHRRRQQEMLLPVEGGAAAKPSETQRWETPSAGASPSSSSKKPISSDSTLPRDDGWQDLAKQVHEEIGLVLKRPNWLPARDWLQAGATPELVLDVVRAVAETERFRCLMEDGKVSTIGYFTPAILRAVEDGEMPRSSAQSTAEPPVSQAPTDLERLTNAWIAGGMLGPAPRLRAA